eukprot:307890_1
MAEEDGYKIGVSIILCVIAILPLLSSAFRIYNPPQALLKGLGITLFADEASYDVGLVNDIAGSGGHMNFACIVMIIGAFIEKLTSTSIIVALIMFWGYAFARVVRMCMDGNPGKGVVQGTVFEVVFGSLAIVALVLHCRATDFCES